MKIENYLEQVYAGVLGKVIGVYMGRPFENWTKDRIVEKWGRVDRFVHEDGIDDKRCATCGRRNKIRGLPLVVADDDITGTFTFVRALEDSGLYADTPSDFFGKTWLNYLIENKTILWWGGMGVSTEHTAYLRLKNGIESPESGSIEVNGRTVAEQIGAQIFIDAFGMVAPGKPELAAELASKAGRVSHDGESVYAAQVVAAMVSAAFVEKDVEKLLDIGVGVIPQSSIIAGVHRDVRRWSSELSDWEDTFDRINEKYGYHEYGGNCHIVPNHAVMVMAWSYAPDDFHRAQVIVNTAGWDTDCNAANVGSVMGLVVGRDRINDRYEFQKAFADRMVMPTAEGSRGVTDCLLEARHIASIGRKVMEWEETEPADEWHDFEMPGALHGYALETDSFAGRNTAVLDNVADPDRGGRRNLQVSFSVDASRFARISTPTIAEDYGIGYGVMSTSRICPGHNITVTYLCRTVDGEASIRLFVRDQVTKELHYSEAAEIATSGTPSGLSFAVPTTHSNVVQDFGFEISGVRKTTGTILVDSVRISGMPRFIVPDRLHEPDRLHGYVVDADVLRGAAGDDNEDLTYITKNEGRGELSFGTDNWRDYQFSARVRIHMADRAGVFVRYRGKQRYLAFELSGGFARLILRNYGETTLAEKRFDYAMGELYSMVLQCDGRNITASIDGEVIIKGVDDVLGRGGAGVFYENGTVGFRMLSVAPL